MTQKPQSYCKEELFETGIGYVVVVRYKSGGRVEVGCFLVDVHCLGVKDAFFQVYSDTDFQSECLERFFPEGIPSPKPAAWGRKLVEQAVIYAARLGFAPHPDFKKAGRVFGGVDASECDEEFVFGSGGKPLYVQGPYDSKDKAEQILAVLRAKCGDGGFDFIVLGGVLDEEDDEDQIGIMAIDSEGISDDPDSLLKTLAQKFSDENGGYDWIKYGGKSGSLMASDFLNQARVLGSEMSKDAGLHFGLSDGMKVIQSLWNFRALPEEDRSQLLSEMPDLMVKMVKEATRAVGNPTLDEQRLILDFIILNQDSPGEERLLLLLEDF